MSKNFFSQGNLCIWKVCSWRPNVKTVLKVHHDALLEKEAKSFQNFMEKVILRKVFGSKKYLKKIILKKIT